MAASPTRDSSAEPAEPPQTPLEKKPAGRLAALDVMRGLTILGMILVNNPGSWSSLYGPVAHADWHGWTVTDLIFPFFLFMVGVAMAYSFRKFLADGKSVERAVYLRILRRVLLLLLLGLILNGSGRIINLLLGNSAELNLETLRWPGVLQRIGLVYLAGAILVLWLSRRWQIVGVVLLQASYWALLVNLPADTPRAERLEPTANLVRSIDIAVIGKQHMWTQSTTEPTDPEGLLSTLTALVNVLFGYRVGRALCERVERGDVIGVPSCMKLIWYGSLLAAAGWFFSHPNFTGAFMPINKALWTPTFVLLSTGLAFITLASCLLVFDIYGKKVRPIQSLGTGLQLVGVNAIFVFVASGFVARLLSIMQLGETNLKQWIYENLIVDPLTQLGFVDPRLHSLSYAICFVAVWWIILWLMWRRGWSIRV